MIRYRKTGQTAAAAGFRHEGNRDDMQSLEGIEPWGAILINKIAPHASIPPSDRLPSPMARP